MIANIIIVVALAAIRIAGHKSDLFKDFAHIYVGGLFAWAFCEYGFTWASGGLWGQAKAVRPAMQKLYLAITISLIELVVGVRSKLNEKPYWHHVDGVADKDLEIYDRVRKILDERTDEEAKLFAEPHYEIQR
jgi:hypothetical protein